MKSEERHRLQETELHKLGRHARDFWESFVKDYGKAILIGIGVACLVAAIVFWWLMSSAAAEAERWKDVIIASFETNPSQSLIQLERAADLHADTPAGQWAALLEAERALRRGVEMTRTDRKASVDELTRARDSFTRLAASDSDMIQERRAFGMACCLEALSGVDLTIDEKRQATEAYGKNVSTKDALDAYKKFVEDYGPQDAAAEAGGGSIFVPFAEERIKALSTERAETFYAMYREEYPKPGDLRRPQDGLPSSSDDREEEMMQELEATVKEAERNAKRQNLEGPELKDLGPNPFEDPPSPTPQDKSKPAPPAEAEKNPPEKPAEPKAGSPNEK